MKNKKKTIYIKISRKFGVEKLGLMSGKRWREDPKDYYLVYQDINLFRCKE